MQSADSENPENILILNIVNPDYPVNGGYIV